MSENRNFFILNILAIIGLLIFLFTTEPLEYSLTHLQIFLVALAAIILFIGLSLLIKKIFPDFSLASK